MTTPYALFEHIPLSECRQLWRALVIAPMEYGDDDKRNKSIWRLNVRRSLCRRALAAVTAERDQILDHLEGTIEQDKALINEYNDLRRQLAAVTAERDKLRQDYTDLLAERDALQFAATQAGRERDALIVQLSSMEGEL